LKFVSEKIQFFPLPQVAFEELMSNPTQVIVIDNSPIGIHFHAHLIYNPEERIGKGTFKTANLASLEFDNARPLVGLASGSLTVDKLSVALKSPFLDVKTASKRPGLRSVNGTIPVPPVSHLTVMDEHHAITGEAKLLVWANALLEFTYDFIFDYAQNNCEPPGVKDFMSIIPLFRFVDAGVAVVAVLSRAPLDQIRSSQIHSESTQISSDLLGIQLLNYFL
jgi:hypothetical protein